MWGIHAGRTGEAESLFLGRKVVALGWEKMGDLSQLPSSREAFKAKLVEAYPGTKPAAVAGTAGQMFRFLHEMRSGDLVVYPSKQQRVVYIGRVEGQYTHEPTGSAGYSHHRSVSWLRHLPRTAFSQGALYEIGSALTFFLVKNYADEYVAAAGSGAVPTPPVAADETVAPVAEDIEETTRDFVLKNLAQELKGHPLADFVAQLLGAMGYRTRVSPEGPDGGVDVLAHKDELGFEPPIIKVQVKSTEGSVGDPVVSALYGKVAASEHALVVTLGSFTPAARSFERSKSNLRLIDGTQLVDLILQHYESLDPRYKGLIPLKRVYVPEPIEGADE